MNTLESEMQIEVNGEERDVAPGSTIADVLRIQDIEPDEARGIAVALNAEVVRREAWDSTAVSEGDAVEIVTASQGG